MIHDGVILALFRVLELSDLLRFQVLFEVVKFVFAAEWLFVVL